MQQSDLLNQDTVCWPRPQSREVALFTDLTLLAEALALASDRSAVTANYLQQALRQRLQRMRLVQSQGKRTVERLLRELKLFGWIELAPPGNGASPSYQVTVSGSEALHLSKQDPRRFRRLLTAKMQEVYVIPGWFVARLWDINPTGQGEVILPMPAPDWQSRSRNWNDNDWDGEIRTQALLAAQSARKTNAAAFPICDEDWLQAVQMAWKTLGMQRPRGTHEGQAAAFSPRARLVSATRTAWLKLLFNRIPYGGTAPDFPGDRPPIYLRTFAGWCPRLEALELIFYTDAHPQISGRLLFPVSAFRQTAPESSFELLATIRDPAGAPLWMHQPKWDTFRDRFVQTLVAVHQQVAAKTGTLYVSLLAVRDEVCRQVRISSLVFDDFLAETLDFLPAPEFPWSIAVETDIREDQSSAPAQYRRPVYLEGVPHFLIGLAHLRA